MKGTLRYRSKGGAVVTWTKTGTSGGHYNYAVGDSKCTGCGWTLTNQALSRAESHADGCKALP